MINSDKRLSLSIPPTTSTSSTLANRRRNNKNLSLCISPETTINYLTSTSEPLKRASFNTPTPFLDNNRKDNLNAYPSGPIKIMPNLYLGNEKNAFDLNHLKNQLSIQAILNVAAEVNHPYEYMFQSMDDLLSISPSPSLSKSSFHTTSTTSTIQTIPDHHQLAYQKLPWDHNQDNLAHELFKAIEIIDKARNANQAILVHCQCGIARSATVIIAYVMKTMNMSTQDAYHHVKNIVPVINPNLSLLFQLREFEHVLKSTCSTTTKGSFTTSLSSAFKRKLSKSIFQSSTTDSWWKSKRKPTPDSTLC